MIALLLAAATIPAGQSFAGTVTGVYDADGPIYVTTDRGERIKVRLKGVGAVEADGRVRPGQPHGILDPVEARRRTSAIVLHKRVRGLSYGASGGRTVAHLWVGRVNVSCAVIASGAGARWGKFDRENLLGGC